jgi:hypothetical protein
MQNFVFGLLKSGERRNHIGGSGHSQLKKWFGSLDWMSKLNQGFLSNCLHDTIMGMITKQQYVGYLICTIGNFTGMRLAGHLDDVSHHVISTN